MDYKKVLTTLFFLLIPISIYRIIVNSYAVKFTDEDAKKAILKLSQSNLDRARVIERLMRLETNHFKSRQYLLCGSGGMEVGKWQNLPSGLSSVSMVENGTGKTKEFIVWNSVEAFVKYLSEYIDRYNGNWARWYSASATFQESYRNKVNAVQNKWV